MNNTKAISKTWIGLLVLLLLFALVNILVFSQKPKVYPDFVSTSPAPTGVKAFYTYLNNELGGTRWTFPPAMLPTNQENRLLVMVEPTFIPNQQEMNEYRQFMEAGNTILLLQSNPKGMFTVGIDSIKGDVAEDHALKVYDQYHQEFKAVISSSIRLHPNIGDKVLLSDQAGPVAVKQSFGKGKLIVAITPEWLTNDNLLNYDHLPLILKLVNESNAKTVLFDEYVHGTQNAASPITLYPKWFLVLLLQGIILLALWLWSKGKRFGPIFIPREETVRFSDEGIRALSAWYLRGRCYRDSLVIQADFVRLLLQEKWGIAYNREWEDILGNLERKSLSIPASELPNFVNGLVKVLGKEQLNKHEYLLWSRNLDRLRKEVEYR